MPDVDQNLTGYPLWCQASHLPFPRPCVFMYKIKDYKIYLMVLHRIDVRIKRDGKFNMKTLEKCLVHNRQPKCLFVLLWPLWAQDLLIYVYSLRAHWFCRFCSITHMKVSTNTFLQITPLWDFFFLNNYPCIHTFTEASFSVFTTEPAGFWGASSLVLQENYFDFCEDLLTNCQPSIVTTTHISHSSRATIVTTITFIITITIRISHLPIQHLPWPLQKGYEVNRKDAISPIYTWRNWKLREAKLCSLNHS